MEEAHNICEIVISFYGRQSRKSGRRWDKLITKEQIEDLIEFLHNTLPLKEIEIYNSKGKLYRAAKTWRLRGIKLLLSEPTQKTYLSEYEEIYKPIDKFLMNQGHAIYNMWGHNDTNIPWQMDGRHAR